MTPRYPVGPPAERQPPALRRVRAQGGHPPDKVRLHGRDARQLRAVGADSRHKAGVQRKGQLVIPLQEGERGFLARAPTAKRDQRLQAGVARRGDDEFGHDPHSMSASGVQQNVQMTDIQNADVPHVAGYDRFTMKQKLTMMVNRYEIRSVNAEGGEGPVIAMAQQKRMAFKEQVAF